MKKGVKFMEMTDVLVHINKAFNKAGYNFDESGVEVAVNKRLTKTLGRCKSKWIGDCLNPYRIEFSEELLTTATDKTIIDVIYHECAHALVGLETGEDHKHDAVFKAMCRRIGTSNDGYCTKVERTVSEDEVYKYFVCCKQCGKVVGKYHRAGNVVKSPWRYSCKCGGVLNVVQNY